MGVDIHDSVNMKISTAFRASESTLRMMQVSALRGIVEMEFAIDELQERLATLKAKKTMIEMSEQAISEILAIKKRDADFAHYLRTGSFPDGD